VNQDETTTNDAIVAEMVGIVAGRLDDGHRQLMTLCRQLASAKPSGDSRAGLALHLVSKHADPMAIERTRAENLDQHKHEHDGPGTIRNHDREWLGWDGATVIEVLAEYHDSRAATTPWRSDAHRGDAVEGWIRDARNQHYTPGPYHTPEWTALDDLLDSYRLHADTGTALNQPVSEHGFVEDAMDEEEPTPGGDYTLTCCPGPCSSHDLYQPHPEPPEVHVDWRMTPDEWNELRRLLIANALHGTYFEKLWRGGKLEKL
jgi:hypothetical protein